MADLIDVTGSHEEELQNEEQVKRLAPLARDVVNVLIKTIRATRMYLPNNPIYKKFKDEMVDKFDAYFAEEEHLCFLVDRFELTFMGQPVYTNPDKEDNIALMFFTDGVREFCFNKGITPEETEAFIDILKTDTKQRELDDDLVTLMWEKDFEHISYTAIDEATDEEAAEEDNFLVFEEEPDAPRQLDELRSRAVADKDAPSPQGAEDEGRSHGAGMLVVEDAPSGAGEEGEGLSAPHPAHEAPDDLALLNELTDIFYEMLTTEKDPARFGMVSDTLSRALDIFVDRGEFAPATILLMKVEDLAALPDLPKELTSRLDAIVAKSGSAPLVAKVGEYIDQGDADTMDVAGSYLRQLDARAVPAMVGLLETMGNRKARRTLCDIITDVLDGSGKPLVEFMGHRHWFVARNIAMVLGKIADPDTLPALAGAMKHDDERVRREAMHALAAIKGPRAVELFVNALTDSNRQNRSLAVKLLVELAPEKAMEALIGITHDKSFEDRAFDEMKDVFENIGRAGGDKALHFLGDIFRKKGFFKSSKRDNLRACSAYGLAAVGGREAAEMLKSEIDSKSKTLRSACLAGLKRIGG